MTSILLQQACQISACSSHSLFSDRQYNTIIRSLYHKRTRSLTRRNRLRRPSFRAPVSPSISRRRRRQEFLQLAQSSYQRSAQRHARWPSMALRQPRFRGSLDRTFSLDAALAAANAAPPAQDDDNESLEARTPPNGQSPSAARDDMPPPPSTGEAVGTRMSRSTSTASRKANKLSLTLPIAQPNSIPSRPTPASSVPQTPAETPTTASPSDPNEFIIAIAAQERRVLELREQLRHAEGELVHLKRNFSASDEYNRRARRPAGLRPAAPISATQSERSVDSGSGIDSDMDRRKAYLLAQSQGTPRDSRRKVISGHHTRALSLLSPTRPSSSGADVQILKDPDVLSSPDSVYSPTPDFRPARLNKRATWAPRQQLTEQPPGVRQLASDFKQGLWTFVEDLRQATVGEEGINGPGESVPRLNRSNTDQDTIRASTSNNRGRIPFPTEGEPSSSTGLSRSNSGSFQERLEHRRTTSKPEPKARKHFSWTPLTFEQFNDDDWSNWDSPNVKTSRWSGSTVNGDIIPAIPERHDENESSLRSKRSGNALRSESPSPSSSTYSSKLEEMPQALLNRLAPSNLKKSAGDFMKEWERSLSTPEDEGTATPPFDNALSSIHISAREM